LCVADPGSSNERQTAYSLGIVAAKQGCQDQIKAILAIRMLLQ